MTVKDPAALLRRLLTEPNETTWLEFKHNNCDPERLGECVSACANAAMLAGKERAFIVFGIENGTRKKLGTSVRLAQKKRGGENLQNWCTRTLNPRIDLEFVSCDEDDLHFEIVAIEPSYDRPVAFDGTEYIRIGENVRKLKEFPEKERALWIATAKHKFEGAIALPHQTAEQVLALLNADAYYALTHQEKPKDPAEVIRRLTQIGCIRDDMEGGFDISNLGAILFANDLRQFPSVATKSVRVVKYVGRDKSKSDLEREGRRGYAIGFANLMQFIHEQVPAEEQYVDGVRRRVPVFPVVALREIIANALIHQDFTMTGSAPIIEIYEDRVEVTNPGSSLIEVDRIIDDRKSRNEKLASEMRQLGLCEERGGGIDKAIIEIEQRSLPAPIFITSDTSMRVVIFGPKRFNQLSKSERIWACFCHCVVCFIRRDFMSNTSLRNRFSLKEEDYQTASAVIAETRKAGKIIPAEEGQGRKHARYLPYWIRPSR